MGRTGDSHFELCCSSFFFACGNRSPYTVDVLYSTAKDLSGGYCVGVPPLPIPNREVKPVCADRFDRIYVFDPADMRNPKHPFLPATNFYFDRYPHELSGGEQQRIGILRAIAAKPQVLLMDEPFSALDPLVRTVLQDQIAMIHQKFGTTIVFVTHDMQEAAKLACRIGVMHNGKLVQIDTPEEIKKQPANDYVQSLFSTADAPDAERIIHQFLRLDKQGQEAVRRAVL